jgi:hypothetical protein
LTKNAAGFAFFARADLNGNDSFAILEDFPPRFRINKSLEFVAAVQNRFEVHDQFPL